MSDRFVHSVKVPRSYKDSAKILKEVQSGKNFKNLVFQKKGRHVQGIYALVCQTLEHSSELDFIIAKSKIFLENPRLDQSLGKVLITALLWKGHRLDVEAKPMQIVLQYQDKLKNALSQYYNEIDPSDKKQVTIPRYVRINTLLTTVDEAIDSFCQEGFNFIPLCDTYEDHIAKIQNLKEEDFLQDFHIPELLIFAPKVTFYNHPSYINGTLILQDKASCLPAFLLNPCQNSEVLDMCAAPGMKTTHLAAIMNNTGKIYAIEKNIERYNTLKTFIATSQAKCVEANNADSLTIAEQYPNVEYILVDPSCSGSGMVKRFDVTTESEKDLSERLNKLQALQSKLLKYALQCFPNVKKVAYSTCSIHPEENEAVVDAALKAVNGAFTVVKMKKKFRKHWRNFGSSNYEFGDKCIYAIPESDFCNGFFIAIFKRNFDIVVPPFKKFLHNDRFSNSHCRKKPIFSNNDHQLVSNSCESVLKKSRF